MTIVKCNRCKKEINEGEALVMVAVVNVPYEMMKAYSDMSGILKYKEIKKQYGEMDFCPDCCKDFDNFFKNK